MISSVRCGSITICWCYRPCGLNFSKTRIRTKYFTFRSAGTSVFILVVVNVRSLFYIYHFITKDKSRQRDYNRSISTPRAFIDCCCVCVCVTESRREGIWQPCMAADLFCCAGDYSLQRAASADTLRPIDWSPGLTLLSRTCLPYWSEVAWHTMTTSPVEPMGHEKGWD